MDLSEEDRNQVLLLGILCMNGNWEEGVNS